VDALPTRYRTLGVNMSLDNTDLEDDEIRYIRRFHVVLDVDTRTTVMIKNNMSDKDLERFIANVRSRTIDFMYLRMDFMIHGLERTHGTQKQRK
jgi:hypothetical protein